MIESSTSEVEEASNAGILWKFSKLIGLKGGSSAKHQPLNHG